MSDGLSGKCAAAMGLCERSLEVGSAVLIEQVEHSRGGASEMSAVQCDVLQEGLGARARGHEAVATTVLARVSLVVTEALEVEGIFELRFALPRASVSRYFDISVEDTHDRIGGNEREWPTHELMRNRIVVGVEAEIRGFARADGADEIARERMGRERQEDGALLGQCGLDGALFDVTGHDAYVSDVSGPIVELSIEVFERMKGARGEERLTNISNGALDAALLVAACLCDGPGSKVIVPCELEQSRMKANDVANALEHCSLEIVI